LGSNTGLEGRVWWSEWSSPRYPLPVVAYLRVSTEKQDLESQWMAIAEWAKSRGVAISERVEETESGAEDARPKFRELWERVRERRVGTIVVAELSRLSRRMRTLVDFLYDCVENDIIVVSVREGWLEESLQNKLMRPIVVGMLSTLYELERTIISERTKSGLQRAKAQGKKVGRPRKIDEKALQQIIKMRNAGLSVTEIARRLGVHRDTIYKNLKRTETTTTA